MSAITTGKCTMDLPGVHWCQRRRFRQERCHRHYHHGRAQPAAVQPRIAVAHDDQQRQQHTEPDAQLILPKTLEQMRRDQRDKNASQGAAGGHREVKGSQIARMRFGPDKLAVANHAADKQNERVDGNLRP